MKKYSYRRKLKKLLGRTGKRFRKKIQYRRKAKMAAKKFKIYSLRPHLERRKKHEIHHIGLVNPNMPLGSVNDATPANRYSLFQFDPSQFAVNQGLSAFQTIGSQINALAIDLQFDISPNDTSVTYANLGATSDTFRAYRMIIVETHNFDTTAAECVVFNAAAQSMYGPVDWKVCKVLYDKIFTDSVPLTTGLAGALVQNQTNVNASAATLKRRHFHFRIPYKATMNIFNNAQPEPLKKLFIFWFSDISQGFSNTTRTQWLIYNQIARLYFRPSF